MPDLEPLPPPPRRPSLTPRDGDWDDMTRRVGRRRKARAYAATGAAASVAAIAVLVSLTSPALDRLVADPATSSSASTSAQPTATPPTSPASPSPVAPPTSPAAGATTAPSPTAEPTSAPSPTAEPTSAPTPVHATLRRTEVAFEASRTCTPGSAEGPGWCVRVPPSQTVQADDPRDYVLDYCRITGSGRATITFDSVYEIWFHVATNSSKPDYVYGDEKWSPHTHSIEVPDGRCARWTLTWDATDEAGKPLRPGRYSVSIGLRANFSTAPPSSTVYGFSLDVTE